MQSIDRRYLTATKGTLSTAQYAYVCSYPKSEELKCNEPRYQLLLTTNRLGVPGLLLGDAARWPRARIWQMTLADFYSGDDEYMASRSDRSLSCYQERNVIDRGDWLAVSSTDRKQRTEQS